jgi:Ran GTPase-activating protein (RanGAP) involved in mRNA processing and transport
MMALKILYNALLKSYCTSVTLSNAACCLQLTHLLSNYISQPNPTVDTRVR